MDPEMVKAISELAGAIIGATSASVIIAYVACYTFKSLMDGKILKEIDEYRKNKIEYLERKRRLKEENERTAPHHAK